MYTHDSGACRNWRRDLTPVQRFLYMLEHGIDTDCTFVVGPEEDETKELKAHRFLLCSASVVFEKMLKGEMLEAKTGHVRVTDFSPNIFQLLLTFVYSGETKEMTFEEAHDVALAADKYELDLLFEKCLYRMSTAVTPKSVWNALTFLQLLPYEPLKQACVKMLQRKRRSV